MSFAGDDGIVVSGTRSWPARRDDPALRTLARLFAARLYILENAVATLQSDVARLVRLVEGLHISFAEMQQEMRTRFAQIDERLDRIEGRLDQVEGRLDRVEGRLDRVEARLDVIETGQRDLTTLMHQIS